MSECNMHKDCYGSCHDFIIKFHTLTSLQVAQILFFFRDLYFQAQIRKGVGRFYYSHRILFPYYSGVPGISIPMFQVLVFRHCGVAAFHRSRFQY